MSSPVPMVRTFPVCASLTIERFWAPNHDIGASTADDCASIFVTSTPALSAIIASVAMVWMKLLSGASPRW